MGNPNSKLNPFLSSTQIQNLVQKLAQQVNQDYQDVLKAEESLLVVVTLKGALLFAADLIRYLSVPVHVDFVRVSSYGSGTRSQGSVLMTKDMESSPKGRHVLILDEIVDTGHTLAFLREKFGESKPASLKVCSLLSKPSRREVNVSVEYVGTEVEDKFLVGYGLDYDEKFRNLKDIYYI